MRAGQGGVESDRRAGGRNQGHLRHRHSGHINARACGRGDIEHLAGASLVAVIIIVPIPFPIDSRFPLFFLFISTRCKNPIDYPALIPIL